MDQNLFKKDSNNKNKDSINNNDNATEAPK